MSTTSFDLSRAIGLSRAAPLMRGKGGRAPSVETVRRWANPARGCYPAGAGGPHLVLRTHKLNGEILTMPEWVEAFELERVRLSDRQSAAAQPVERTSRKRQGEVKRAQARLDRAGIGGQTGEG